MSVCHECTFVDNGCCLYVLPLLCSPRIVDIPIKLFNLFRVSDSKDNNLLLNQWLEVGIVRLCAKLSPTMFKTQNAPSRGKRSKKTYSAQNKNLCLLLRLLLN